MSLMQSETEIKQAVILAGGRGERLRPLTNDLPKPLAPINDIPFLDYLIATINQAGIKRILLLLGYRSGMIIDRYSKPFYNDEMQIEFSVGHLNDQTGRRLINAYELLDNTFLLLYGDNYWPIEWDNMINLYKRKNVEVMTTVFGNRNGTGEYGKQNNVTVGEDAFVKCYDKGRKSENLNGVDIGYFIVSKNILNPHRIGNISFEEDILPELISQKQLIAYITNTQYYYITTMESLKTFEAYVKQNDTQYLSRGDNELFPKVF